MGKRKESRHGIVGAKKWVKPEKFVVEIPKLEISKDDMAYQTRLMSKIMKIQSCTYGQDRMINHISNTIKAYNSKADIEIILRRDGYGNMYLTKGISDTYPCVIAHLDTVHSIIPNSSYRVFSAGGKMFAMNLDTCRRTGIGGDDKVGIFIAISLLLSENYPTLKVAFFKDEEHGCVGSSKADLKWFDNVSFALQADRKEYTDFVNSSYSSGLYGNDFKEAIAPVLKRFKKVESSGGLTDVVQLSEDGIGIAVANCSCGYYNPHTAEEYIVIDEVLLTLQLFGSIIDEVFSDGERFVETYTTKKVYGGGYGRIEARDFYPHRGMGYGAHSDIDQEPNDYRAYTPSIPDTTCPVCQSIMIFDDITESNYCFNCDDYIY